MRCGFHRNATPWMSGCCMPSTAPSASGGARFSRRGSVFLRATGGLVCERRAGRLDPNDGVTGEYCAQGDHHHRSGGRRRDRRTIDPAQHRPRGDAGTTRVLQRAAKRAREQAAAEDKGDGAIDEVTRGPSRGDNRPAMLPHTSRRQHEGGDSPTSDFSPGGVCETPPPSACRFSPAPESRRHC